MTNLAAPTTAATPLHAVLPGNRGRVPTWVFWVLGALAIGLAAAMLFADLERLAVGGLGVALLLVLLALGVPIGYGMIAAGGIGLFALVGAPGLLQATSSIAYDSVASWALNVVPLFILMGILMWKSGVTGKAYDAARQWLSWLPGGLAVSTTFAGAGLATTSGTTMGTTFALGRIGLPEMFKSGYKPSLATGAVAMAGSLGQVLPPSVLLVIYAGVAQVSVGAQLLAGILPGILLAIGFALVCIIWAILRPSVAPKADLSAFSWPGRFRALVGLIPLVVIGGAVIGGMFLGVFTASEAAAAGVVLAMIVGWASLGRGRRGFRSTVRFLSNSTLEAVAAYAGLFIILIGALMLGRFLTLSGVAQALSGWLVDMNLDRVQILLLLIVVYIVLGMFLESLPMILLTVPFLQAPLEALGVDMIWFGIFLVILCEIGLVFPPIGLLTFVVHRIAQDPQVNRGVRVSLADVFRGTMPFVALALVVIVALIIWPEIALFLPDSARQAP